MSSPPVVKPICVALIGNPNTGKSSLFSALAGVRQRVGNYPGVTVEKKLGQMSHEGRRFTLVDLPGTYSLAPRSPDEMVAVDVLLGRQADAPRPDAVLCIVDASNLERNLYLVSQVLELGLPTVLALNMVDIAASQGTTINLPLLRERLGIPVVEVQANRGRGIAELKRVLDEVAVNHVSAPRISPFPAAFVEEVAALGAELGQHEGVRRRWANPANSAIAAAHHDPANIPRFLVERLLLDSGGYLEGHLLAHTPADEQVRRELVAARQRLAGAGLPVPAVEAMSRYTWVGQTLEGVVARPATRRETSSDRIDKLLTHWASGSLVFLLLMVIVFQSVFQWAGPASDAIDAGMGWLGEGAEALLSEGPLRSLLVDGLIGGVGGVLVFLPQILVLFFFIALLEDCGYMARAAYLMDRLMVHVGLSGKSFIPMLSSFACAIPGIMATRVIENRRDRLTTILVAPLMSCSARLPVYVLLTAAFIPPISFLGGWLSLNAIVISGMYLLGIVVAAAMAFLLKRTLLRGPTPPFVMELPPYKWPSPRLVLLRMIERGWSFVRRAGTLIVAVSIIVWALLYYPHDEAAVEGPYRAQVETLETQLAALPEDDPRREPLAEELAGIENQIAGEYQRSSYLGQLGQIIEPVVRPLGWDWRIGCAALASFPAREIIVATLGILYNLGDEVDEGSNSLHEALRSATWDGTDVPVFNIPVALSIMVFFALCAQCAATLVVIRRETNSWRWPLFTFAYMTALAWVGAFVTYQGGMWIAGLVAGGGS